MAHRLTTCTFCGVGCGIYLETQGGHITGACPSMSHPTNAGKICVRGWHVHEVASSPDRLRRPLVRARLAGARLIVVDARRHRIAEHTDPFLQVRPGTDVFLYGAMAKVIVDRGLLNLPFLKARVRNLPAFLEAVAQYDLLDAAARRRFERHWGVRVWTDLGIRIRAKDGAAFFSATVSPDARRFCRVVRE